MTWRLEDTAQAMAAHQLDIVFTLAAKEKRILELGVLRGKGSTQAINAALNAGTELWVSVDIVDAISPDFRPSDPRWRSRDHLYPSLTSDICPPKNLDCKASLHSYRR